VFVLFERLLKFIFSITLFVNHRVNILYHACMTSRDTQYLAKLRDYYATHHVLPSFATVAKLIGLHSTSAVAAMVARMKRDGFLSSSPDRRLQPGARFFESVLAHSVQAGMPQPANEGLVVGYDIAKHLVKVPSRTVLLKIRGESMIDAGLMPGDYVVVQKGTEAKLGDIVVAMVRFGHYLARAA